MRILLLAEGDAERWDAWSGSAKSLVDHLRAAGHSVITADVDLYGSDRWLTAVRAFSPTRARWAVKFHLADPGYRARSLKAGRAIVAQRGRVGGRVQTHRRGLYFIHRWHPAPVEVGANLGRVPECRRRGVRETLRHDHVDLGHHAHH